MGVGEDTEDMLNGAAAAACRATCCVHLAISILAVHQKTENLSKQKRAHRNTRSSSKRNNRKVEMAQVYVPEVVAGWTLFEHTRGRIQP